MYSGIEHIISVSFSLCHIMFIPCKFGKHGKDYDKVGGGGGERLPVEEEAAQEHHERMDFC